MIAIFANNRISVITGNTSFLARWRCFFVPKRSIAQAIGVQSIPIPKFKQNQLKNSFTFNKILLHITKILHLMCIRKNLVKYWELHFFDKIEK